MTPERAGDRSAANRAPRHLGQKTPPADLMKAGRTQLQMIGYEWEAPEA